ncbi:hypothetical protein [Sellimonas intestinalis]|uniref:hypothetical protein n=1 Tax=Sellimonas intestinalis TaxID=1653434 RepID=UPI003994625B
MLINKDPNYRSCGVITKNCELWIDGDYSVRVFHPAARSGFRKYRAHMCAVDSLE